MENSTIHIFGFKSTQIISLENNFMLKSEELTTLQPLIDAIWDLKSPEVTEEKEYNVIHIFNGTGIRWQSNFKVLVDVTTDSLKDLIDSLVAEMITLKPAPKTKEPIPMPPTTDTATDTTTDTATTPVKKKK
jgi:hypothetical protein